MEHTEHGVRSTRSTEHTEYGAHGVRSTRSTEHTEYGAHGVRTQMIDYTIDIRTQMTDCTIYHLWYGAVEKPKSFMIKYIVYYYKFFLLLIKIFSVLHVGEVRKWDFQKHI